MTQPAPQSAPEAQTANRGLWAEAPGWRNLTIVAAVLTAVAVAAPLALQDNPRESPDHAVPTAAQAPAPPSRPLAPPPSPIIQTAQPQQAIPAAPPRIIYVPVPTPATPPAPLAPAAPPAPSSRAAAVAAAQPTPQTQPVVQPASCALRQPATPSGIGGGVVTLLEDRATSLARIPRTEALMGGRIDPDYVDNLRVIVRMDGGENVVIIVPKTMVPHVGDRVTVQGGYRNAALPCNYIPNLITADLGPAANASRIVSTPDGR